VLGSHGINGITTRDSTRSMATSDVRSELSGRVPFLFLTSFVCHPRVLHFIMNLFSCALLAAIATAALNVRARNLHGVLARHHSVHQDGLVKKALTRRCGDHLPRSQVKNCLCQFLHIYSTRAGIAERRHSRDCKKFGQSRELVLWSQWCHR
jgi:hypothetical protein